MGSLGLLAYGRALESRSGYPHRILATGLAVSYGFLRLLAYSVTLVSTGGNSRYSQTPIRYNDPATHDPDVSAPSCVESSIREQAKHLDYLTLDGTARVGGSSSEISSMLTTRGSFV